jgi:ribosomal protein S18 acetylase RimI-like enzyme
MLSISEQFQNKKIGSDLLNYFFRKISEKGVKFVELEVRIENEKAINFYKKHGFKIRNEIKDFYQNGESAYTMKKEL